MSADKPGLDPYPGGVCNRCGAPLTFDDPPFCAECEEVQQPMTFNEFLAYAAGSTVNGGSGRWPK